MDERTPDQSAGAQRDERRWDVTRRAFVGSMVAGGVVAATPASPARAQRPPVLRGSVTINGRAHAVPDDPRVTLLDFLRERVGLSGTKKGCDHGQCGACTVLANGRRINSCLSLAVAHDGDDIVTIEGLARGDQLHPMQAAFVEHDALQCGYCTPGQICSALGMLAEVRAGAVSAAMPDVRRSAIELTDDEIRERMSGNLCRCGAYPNIVAAVRAASRGSLG
jgi:xanthine dehydrogenase YagT iron-sulfur-binding subunit